MSARSFANHLYLAFALVILGACSSGSSGGANPSGGESGGEAPPINAFVGTWDVVVTKDKTVQPGNRTTKLTIADDGSGITATLEGSEFVGTLAGGALTLRKGDRETFELEITADDEIRGTGLINTPIGTGTNTVLVEIELLVVGTREVSVSNPTIAATQGSWTFVVDLASGGQLVFPGVLAQNGATVTFEFADQQVVPPISQEFRGDVLGRAWSPTVTGTLEFKLSGSFAVGGTEFTGDFLSADLGAGTVSGRAL